MTLHQTRRRIETEPSEPGSGHRVERLALGSARVRFGPARSGLVAFGCSSRYRLQASLALGSLLFFSFYLLERDEQLFGFVVMAVLFGLLWPFRPRSPAAKQQSIEEQANK